MTSCPVCGIAAPWGCVVCAVPDQVEKFTLVSQGTRHVRRANNLRRLLAELGQRELSRDDIYQLLGIGESCLRNYLFDVSSLIEVIENGYKNQRSYRLTATPEQVAAFLISLEAPRPPVRRIVRDALSLARRNPSRHFHILADDVHHKVKVHRRPVMPDPLALPVAFFARAVAMGAHA